MYARKYFSRGFLLSKRKGGLIQFFGCTVVDFGTAFLFSSILGEFDLLSWAFDSELFLR